MTFVLFCFLGRSAGEFVQLCDGRHAAPVLTSCSKHSAAADVFHTSVGGGGAERSGRAGAEPNLAALLHVRARSCPLRPPGGNKPRPHFLFRPFFFFFLVHLIANIRGDPFHAGMKTRRPSSTSCGTSPSNNPNPPATSQREKESLAFCVLKNAILKKITFAQRQTIPPHLL